MTGMWTCLTPYLLVTDSTADCYILTTCLVPENKKRLNSNLKFLKLLRLKDIVVSENAEAMIKVWFLYIMSGETYLS